MGVAILRARDVVSVRAHDTGKDEFPMPFKSTLPLRFWRKVNAHPSGCWFWQAVRNNGYGRFHVSYGVSVYAHRAAYESLRGPIPTGLQIDHLCRNQACVNPRHMEAVTNRDNTIRGVGRAAYLAALTHCQRGHPFDIFNTYQYPSGRRQCRECRRYREKNRING